MTIKTDKNMMETSVEARNTVLHRGASMLAQIVVFLIEGFFYILKTGLFFFALVVSYYFVINGGLNFVIPLTDYYVNIGNLIDKISISQLFFEVGPFTLFISPFSLLPLPLPDSLPLKHSFVYLSLYNHSLPLTCLFFNLILFPSLTLVLPTLSSLSLSSIPRFDVKFSLISVSIACSPLQVLAVQVFSDLRSLFFERTYGWKIEVLPISWVRVLANKPAVPLNPHVNEQMTEELSAMAEEYLKAVSMQTKSDNAQGGCISLMTSPNGQGLSAAVGVWAYTLYQLLNLRPAQA